MQNVRPIGKALDKLNEGSIYERDWYLENGVSRTLGINDEKTKSAIKEEICKHNVKDIIGSAIYFRDMKLAKALKVTRRLCKDPSIVDNCDNFWKVYVKQWEDVWKEEILVAELHEKCCKKFVKAKKTLEKLGKSHKGTDSRMRKLEKQQNDLRELKTKLIGSIQKVALSVGLLLRKNGVTLGEERVAEGMKELAINEQWMEDALKGMPWENRRPAAGEKAICDKEDHVMSDR
ncbi:uncharacterized protein FOMMEDRAFT_161232 [Fomitiporia mediterranea MF3/22]|uniref:uncharacterized protein n=1 Tax=Fomitiporia mediterranea (strain MF3/22) TaxID=694068 RepID=UPI00044084AB|nr:uncharacterized protein FOMMEDRAFT_161232 [Fomitiporia mediterranea MF3/22]EJC99022.1 hypothetical protein FOMMEDRAFT_161232 [Fomitiporia mediterranea MF3/22]